MPIVTCPNPSNISANLEDGELVKINADELALRDAPGTSSTILKYISYGTIISRLEKATDKVNGYYWDRVSTPYGYGYIARETSNGSKIWLIPIEETANYGSNNNVSNPDSNGIIKVEPSTTANKIIELYASASIFDSEGNEISGDSLIGTGSRIKIDDNTEYVVIKVGDINSDGKISPADYVRIKNHIMDVTKIDGNGLISADINGDGNITPADYVRVKNHIMGVSSITL